jgi:hypothetical protein
VLLETILFAYLCIGLVGFVSINVISVEFRGRLEPMSLVYLVAWPFMDLPVVMMVMIVGIPAAFVWLLSCLV